MKNKLEERMNALKAEHESGQKMLADIDAKRKQVNDTLLRIEGAMAILKELADEEERSHANGSANAHDTQAPSAAPLS